MCEVIFELKAISLQAITLGLTPFIMAAVCFSIYKIQHNYISQYWSTSLKIAFITFMVITTLLFILLFNLQLNEDRKLYHPLKSEEVKVVKGKITHLHDYNDNWDITKFSVNGVIFSYNIEDINLLLFHASQQELSQYNGKEVFIKYLDKDKIVEFSVCH